MGEPRVGGHILGSPIISIALGWRKTLIILGSTGVISPLPAYLTLRDRGSPHRGTGGDLLLRRGDFWLLFFIQLLRLGSYYTFIAWLPLLLREEYGLNIITAGVALSIFNISGMLSNPLGGVFSDRFGERLILFSTFMSRPLWFWRWL